MLIGVYEALNASLTKATNVQNYYYSSADLYDVLARGEDLVIQVVADSLSGVSAATVSVGLEGSNDGMVWFPLVGIPVADAFKISLALTTGTDGTQFPATAVGNTAFASVKLPAKVRVVAWVDTGTVAVRVIVAVRGEVAR